MGVCPEVLPDVTALSDSDEGRAAPKAKAKPKAKPEASPKGVMKKPSAKAEPKAKASTKKLPRPKVEAIEAEASPEEPEPLAAENAKGHKEEEAEACWFWWL